MDIRRLLKSYDLRAVAGTELRETDYEVLWKAFARLIPEKTFALGMDARTSSPSFAAAFAEGVVSQGKDVVDLGLCSTDMLQFATTRHDGIGAGFMITASHNPKEYNGLKCCGKNAVPINLKEWAAEIAETIDAGFNDAPIRGNRTERTIVADWAEHVASFASRDFSGLKIVADAGNGVAGVFMEAVAERLGFELVPLYFEPDGNFPNHHPSPIESKNTFDLVRAVRETGADLWVAFDGDADRAVLCDEMGEIVSASALICSIAEWALLEKPWAKIAHNIVTSRYVPDFITKLGGLPVRTKVGHVYIKEMMRADPSITFAGEHSGHYYFRKNANADSGVIAFVHFLSIMAKKGRKASEIRKEYERYPAIEETNFQVDDVAAATARVRARYPGIEGEFFDGMTLETKTFRINVRPSSNEPLLRLNLEADDARILETEFKKIEDAIRG